MKLNSSTKIISSKVVLVPYRISHVEKYHKWMECEQLRNLTSSERLSLSEEYEMQQTWLRDENKCTFIVLDKCMFEINENEIESMIGDANLYLTKTEDNIIGEIGLMIAESKFRRQGFGTETLLCLLNYGIKRLNISKFVAIISMDNLTSLNMFNKLNFTKISESFIFKEITMEKTIDSEFVKYLEQNATYNETLTEENK